MRFLNKDLRQPCLYIWWRENTALYVGMSYRLGVERALSAHPGCPAFLALCDTDMLEIRPRPGVTLQSLRDEERELITELSPRWNLRNEPHTYNTTRHQPRLVLAKRDGAVPALNV